MRISLIIGIVLICAGIGGFNAGIYISSIFLIVSGLFLLSIFKNFEVWQRYIIAIICFLISGFFMPKDLTKKIINKNIDNLTNPKLREKDNLDRDTNFKDKEKIIIKDKQENVAVEKDALLNKSKFNLYDSDLYFDVEIFKVDFIEKKNYFSIEEEKYAKPRLVDGIEPRIFFRITNPYRKEYIVPIPEYYTIIEYETGVFLDTVSLSDYNRMTRRETKGLSTNLLDVNGNKIYYKSSVGGQLVDFKENQHKEFQVRFEPILKDKSSKIYFRAFYTQYKNAPFEEVWFLIDLKTKSVVKKIIKK